MGRSGRLFLLVRPYTLLFVANLVATFVASVLDGATFVLLIPFLRTLFGLAPLPELGGSSVERVLAVVVGPLLAAGSAQGALRNVVLVLLATLALKNALTYLPAVSSVVIQEDVERDLRGPVFGQLPPGRLHQAGAGVCGGRVRGRSLPEARPRLPQGRVAGAALRAPDESGERGVRRRGDRTDLRGRHTPGARGSGGLAARDVDRVHRRRAPADVSGQVRGQLPDGDGRGAGGGGPGGRSARSRLGRRRPAGRGARAVGAAVRVPGRAVLVQRAGAGAGGRGPPGLARAGGGRGGPIRGGQDDAGRPAAAVLRADAR